MAELTESKTEQNTHIKGRWWDIKVGEIKKIQASYNTYKEWKQDSSGYFLIKINRETQEISTGFCTNDNVLRVEIVGKNAEEIYNTILREELVSSLQHAAYLGLELQKAEIALKLNLKYIQDSPLDLSTLAKQQ